MCVHLRKQETDLPATDLLI